MNTISVGITECVAVHRWIDETPFEIVGIQGGEDVVEKTECCRKSRENEAVQASSEFLRVAIQCCIKPIWAMSLVQYCSSTTPSQCVLLIRCLVSPVLLSLF